MKRILGLLLLTAGLAHAAPAIRLDGICGLLDSDGRGITITASRVVLTPTAPAAGIVSCTGAQTFPALHTVRWNYANTGELCGIQIGDAMRFSPRWQETISAAGRITLTCVTE